MEQRLESYLNTLHHLADIKIDTSKPFRLYVRSADTVYRQAKIYRSEGDLEKAFILFLKYSNLVLKELPRHPEYGGNSSLLSPLRGNLLTALDVLEQSKPILLENFKNMEKQRVQNEQRERELAEARRRDQEAKVLAEKALKNHEESRRQRIIEMQKLDLARSYEKLTDLSTIPLQNSTPQTTTPPVSVRQDNFQQSLLDLPNYPSIMESKREVDPSKNKILLEPKYYLENGMPLRPIEIPNVIITKFMDLASSNTKKNLETCGLLAGKLSHDSFTITTLIIPKQTSTSDTVTMLGEEEIWDVQDSKDLLTLGWIHTHPTQDCFMSSVDLHTHYSYQALMAEAIAIVVAPTKQPNFGIFRLTDPPGLGTISKCQQRGFHQHNSDKPIYRDISVGNDGHARFSPSIPLDIIDLR